MSVKIRKNIVCEKDYIWNLVTCSCENCKYAGSIMDDSVITCGEIIETTITVPTTTVPTKSTSTKTVPVTCKTENFYILFAFLLITITVLIVVSIYCWFIKYRAKQKHLLAYHNTSIKLKEIYIKNI